jgi:putative endonuclease
MPGLTGHPCEIMKEAFYVYILTNKKCGTLYVGMTSNLVRRIWEHKNKVAEGFTKKYGLDRLVYYEVHQNAESAIIREKRLQNWNRAWKIELIQKGNPDWEDLYMAIIQ